ncbi:MAG: UMP kinase [Candidatus Undinarchaeales archaeon]
MKAVLKIGGSVIAKEALKLDIKKLVQYLKKWSKKHELAIVVGGGRTSRALDSLARQFTDKEKLLDNVGIYASRLNASVLIAALDEHACTKIPRNESEFSKLAEKCKDKIIVSGGFRPGQRTDAVSVQIAKAWGADTVFKCTNVDYVYDKDPLTNPDAEPIEEMTFEELEKLADKSEKANSPTIMDKVAADMLLKEDIKLVVLDGKNLGNIGKALNGKKFRGTKIGFE